MTLPSFIGVGTAQWIASNNAAIPTMAPVNGNIGDLLLLVIERNDTTAAPTVAGWTNIAAATGTNSTTQSSAAYWKVATSATGTSDATGALTWGSGTTVRGGVVLRFRDVSAVAPVHGTPTLNNVASTATTVNATNQTTTVNNCIAVFVASMIGARSTTNTTTNWTAGTGVTAFASQQTSLGNDETIGYGSKTFATAGSLLTPGIIWTTNTTTGVGQGILIALREQFTPNAPTTAAPTSIASTSFTANWSAPATDSTHDAATGYQLDVATDNAFSSLVVGFNNLDVGNVIAKSVTGLAASTQYYYRVRAYNNAATPASGNSSRVGVPSDSYGNAVFNTTGLVAYWRLDETSGVALDVIGSRNGAVTSVTTSQAGLLTGTDDPAYGFDGSTSTVIVPFASALNPATVTVEAWAKASTSGIFGEIVGSFASNGGYELRINSGDSWQFIVVDSGGTGIDVHDPTVYTPPQSVPYHVVGVYDGANSSLYVNGTLVAGPTALTYAQNASRDLGIGNNGQTVPSEFFSGTLDEIAIYNVALSGPTILDHYTKGTTAAASPIPPGLGPVVGMAQPFMFDTAMMR